MQRYILLAIATATALCALPTLATAEERYQRVSYSDLDIATETGADALLSRIERAARNVCHDPMDSRAIGGRDQARACMADSIERAIRELNQPVVEARFDRRHATPVTVAAR